MIRSHHRKTVAFAQIFATGTVGGTNSRNSGMQQIDLIDDTKISAERVDEQISVVKGFARESRGYRPSEEKGSLFTPGL